MEARKIFFYNNRIEKIQTHQVDEVLGLTEYRTDFDINTTIQLAQLKKDIKNDDWSQTNDYVISLIIKKFWNI